MLGAAILSPLLCWGGHWLLGVLPESGSFGWLRHEIAKAEFPKFFGRAVLICALLGLWPLIRWAGFDRSLFPKWAPLGTGLRELGVGFIFAAGLLLLLGWYYLHAGIYKLRPQPAWSAVGPPLFTALCVGFIEEFFFRGALLGLLLRSTSRWKAVFWGTFIFAIVHFMRPPEGVTVPADRTHWGSGFEMIGLIARGFGDLDFLLAEFLTLFAVGWVVALGRVRTGRLWVGIGLHAGWVFGLKYFSALTGTSKALRAGDYLPWVGINLKVGLVPFVVVSLTGVVVFWLLARIQPRAGTQG